MKTKWHDIKECLPNNQEVVLLECYEFGCEPMYVIVKFIQLDKNYLWELDRRLSNRPLYVADQPRRWSRNIEMERQPRLL